MTSSTRPGRGGAGWRCMLLIVGGLVLSSCTAGPGAVQEPATSGAAGGPPPSPTGTSGVGPGTEPTTHDGRTVLPARPQDCSSPEQAGIRDVLGPVADQLQAPSAQSATKDGLVDVICTFGLAPISSGQAADPGNALLITTTTAGDEAVLKNLELPRLMMAPEEVSGVGNKAWYSLNRLSGSTEYVLEVVDGARITRIALAVPSATAPIEGMQQKLVAIAALP